MAILAATNFLEADTFEVTVDKEGNRTIELQTRQSRFMTRAKLIAIRDSLALKLARTNDRLAEIDIADVEPPVERPIVEI